MKSALVYLLMTRLKAQLKELVRKPARIVYLVLVVALFAVALLGGGGDGGAARDARELPALAGAFYGLMFVILVGAGFKNGASMFTLADVNLIFPAPIRARAALYYGLFRQFGASLLLGLFLLFQYGWLHSLYGVGVGVLILIVALYGVSVFLAQVVAMAAYSLTSRSPRRRTLAKGLVYGVLGAFAAAVVARAALAPGGLTLASLVDAADSPLFHLMPVAGWTAAILSGAMTGDLAMLGAYAALTAAFLAAVVVLIARYDHDYYEDVLRTAEISHSAITAQKEGRVADSAPANVKVGKVGLGGGWGASAVYFKHRLEDRRARRYLLSPTSLVFAAIVIGFAFFMRENGALPVFLMAVYMQMFAEALSRFGRELTKPYIYLIPESPFAKLLAALRQSVAGGLAESVVVFVPAGLILGLDAWTIAALVFARWSFTLVYNADTVAEMRLFGGVSSKFLTMVFYLLLMLAHRPAGHGGGHRAGRAGLSRGAVLRGAGRCSTYPCRCWRCSSAATCSNAPNSTRAGSAGGQRLRLGGDASMPHEQGAWMLLCVSGGAVRVQTAASPRAGTCRLRRLGRRGDGETGRCGPVPQKGYPRDWSLGRVRAEPAGLPAG